jgi:PiT family inorganic phosphate transporter
MRDYAALYEPELSPAARRTLDELTPPVYRATEFAPLWVSLGVAFALGIGTMIGWRRIVVTVGEKIGKTHLTYAQGMSAEIVAMSTVFGADLIGLPVSTTHVLSSGIAGTMAASRSGLQMKTVRAILSAWILTLPVTMAISAALFVAASWLAGTT